jgi:ACR3 family arsenite efflux pump ArsB
MYDLREKKKKINKLKLFFNKIKIIHIIYFIILLIIIFPNQSGKLIGNWLSDFFITIIDIIKK